MLQASFPPRAMQTSEPHLYKVLGCFSSHCCNSAEQELGGGTEAATIHMLQLYGSAHVMYCHCASTVREAYSKEGSAAAREADGTQPVMKCDGIQGDYMQVLLCLPTYTDAR
jgi:hypothetical protein